jgi:SAM-dependent methyltransferase/ribosomal protein S18 acetylase RimI-like enzyme
MSDEIILETLMEEARLLGNELSTSKDRYEDFVLAFDRSRSAYIYLKRYGSHDLVNDLLTSFELRTRDYSVVILKDSLKEFSADWKREVFRTHVELFMRLDVSGEIGSPAQFEDIVIDIPQGYECIPFLSEFVSGDERSAFLLPYMMKKCKTDDPGISCFIAKVFGRPVSVLLQLMDSGYAVIEWIITVPEFRQKGIGSLLVCFASNHARSKGAGYIYAKVHPRHELIFDKIGFKIIERLEFYKFRLPRTLEIDTLPQRAGYNGVLKSARESMDRTRILQQLSLPTHFDPPKNWDSYAALDIILGRFGTCRSSKKILDAGGESYSSILSDLEACGYKDLHCLNISFTKQEKYGNIVYQHGDLMNTKFEDGTFDAVVCLSVIEHGIDLVKYFREMKRILKTGGLLITSTDYWHAPIDTSGRRAYDSPVKIFNSNDITGAIGLATGSGFKLMGQLDLECNEKVVNWLGLKFTFIYFTLCKV